MIAVEAPTSGISTGSDRIPEYTVARKCQRLQTWDLIAISDLGLGIWDFRLATWDLQCNLVVNLYSLQQDYTMV